MPAPRRLARETPVWGHPQSGASVPGICLARFASVVLLAVWQPDLARMVQGEATGGAAADDADQHGQGGDGEEGAGGTPAHAGPAAAGAGRS